MLYPESSYFSPLTTKGVETICSDEVIHTLADIPIQKKKRERREKEREKDRNQRYRAQGTEPNRKGLVSEG